MNKQFLKDSLKSLGLDNDQSELYLYLCEAGEKTPLDISRETNLNRSKIYRLTEVLKAKHLIEESETAWGKKIKAAPAENLELVIKQEETKLEEKKNLLGDLIEDIKSISTETSNSFSVKYYAGIEGLRQMIWNELKSKEILTFGFEQFNDMIGKNFAEKIREEYVIRKINIKELTNSKIEFNFSENIAYSTKNYEGRSINSKLLEIKHAIDIHNNIISIFDWKVGKPSGIEIHNKALASMFKQIFNHYWEIAKK